MAFSIFTSTVTVEQQKLDFYHKQGGKKRQKYQNKSYGLKLSFFFVSAARIYRLA